MFITLPTTRKPKTISILDLLDDIDLTQLLAPIRNSYDTRTYNLEDPDDARIQKVRDLFNPGVTKVKLENFCTKYDKIVNAPDKSVFYRHFEIPKKGSFGTRPIDAPTDEMRNALNDLKEILENDFHAAYHTCAFAYIPHRSTKTCVERHKANKSRWFLKIDLHGFFPNTTPEFLFKMLYMTYPMCDFIRFPGYKELFEKVMSICFLRGGLPQGSPVSPMLTNMMMIPIDYTINKWCHYRTPYLVYTRYADDMCFSSAYSFMWSEVTEFIKKTLSDFGASFELNTKKTHYGSNAGRNWMLGIMYNKDFDLTVGYRKKEEMRAYLNNFAVNCSNGKFCSVEDAQILLGKLNYINQIEPGWMDKVVAKTNAKRGVDCIACIKAIIKGEC